LDTPLEKQCTVQPGCTGDCAKHRGELAEQLKALADATRLHIIYLLMTRGEMCVCELMPSLALSQSIVSFHLKTLKCAGFITARKEGKWMYYTLNRRAFQQFCDDFGCMFNLDDWPEPAGGDMACRHPGCRSSE